MKKFFTKDQRLKSRHEFKRVFRNSKRLFSRYCCIHYCENSKELARLGITVTKKFGKAHDRNAFKRRAREAFRKLDIKAHVDLNIRPLLTADKVNFNELEHDIRDCLKKL